MLPSPFIGLLEKQHDIHLVLISNFKNEPNYILVLGSFLIQLLIM
jgi:hypothetical protein